MKKLTQKNIAKVKVKGRKMSARAKVRVKIMIIWVLVKTWKEQAK